MKKINKIEKELRRQIINTLLNVYDEEISATYNFEEFYIVEMKDSYGNVNRTKIFNDKVVESCNGIFEDEYTLLDYILCCL